MAPNVKVFALSTCIHCKQAKQFLDDKNVVYECIHVDLLTGDDRKQAIEAVKKVNPSLSFPTIVVGDTVIVGFRKDEILTALEG